MIRTAIVFGFCIGLCGATSVGARNARAQDAAAVFQQQVLPVLKRSCVDCHSGPAAKGKLDLSGTRSAAQLRGSGAQWFRVLERVESGSMPPADAPPLSTADRSTLAAWVKGELTPLLVAEQRQAGRSRLRRLSRQEYANTVQDLFGIRPAVGRNLPADGRVDGYDKVSGALPISAASTEGYMKIAEDTLTQLFSNPPKPKGAEPTGFRLWAGASEQSKGHILELPDGTMVSFNTDTTSGPLRLKSAEGKLLGGGGARIPGLHKLRISAYGYQTDQPMLFGIYAGHTGAYPQLIELVKVLEAPPGKPGIIEAEVMLRTRLNNDVAPVNDGFRLVPFGLGVQVPKNTQASDCKGPGLAVQWVDVVEPELPLLGERWLTADFSDGMRDYFSRPPAQAKKLQPPRDELTNILRRTFHRVGARLFRRDLSEAEVERIVQGTLDKLDAGDSAKGAFQEAVASLMTAPDFLTLLEQPGRLTDFAMASRLSYFLWNSTPDDELLAVAREGKLSQPDVLRGQTERLLSDARSQRFVKDFTDQWLGLWGIDNTTPDKDLYPEYSDLLKMSSQLETHGTMQHMLDKNLSVRDFVAPRWALVNDRLAKFYGFGEVSGFALREVPLPAETPFGGIWTQAATMKVTANGTLTSPVKRGVWVAERLLGVSIPPPPANIDPVDPDTRGAKTLREQLALHSSQGSCAACHAKFDPYGFALESFDVMGNFRTKYRVVNADLKSVPANARTRSPKWKDGLPVDSTGITPEGQRFQDVRELRAILAKNPAQLARGVTRHLLTYATGEPTTPLDAPTIDAIVAATQRDNYGLRSLVHAVVQSDLFRSK